MCSSPSRLPPAHAAPRGPRARAGWQHKLSVWQALQSQPSSWQRIQDARLSLCHPSEWGGGSPRLWNVYLLIKMAGIGERGITPVSNEARGTPPDPGGPRPAAGPFQVCVPRGGWLDHGLGDHRPGEASLIA